jgi:hypothetical protein
MAVPGDCCEELDMILIHGMQPRFFLNLANYCVFRGLIVVLNLSPRDTPKRGFPSRNFTLWQEHYDLNFGLYAQCRREN